MAFVPSVGPFARTGSFGGAAVDTRKPSRVSFVRMAAGDGSGEFGQAGKSMWKESLFTGGMPGGETFYRAWVEDGMTKDFPDMPDSMQAKSEFRPTTQKKGGVLGMLDNIEFFKGFSRGEQPEPDAPSDDVAATPDAAATAAAVPVPAIEETADPEAPSEALFAPYFPASTRNLAPEIKITYEKDYFKDRVSLAMTEVTSSPTDVYFPKEMKGKAPIIEVSYNGCLAGAYVSVKLDDVEGLPTLPPPPRAGEAVTSLVPGAGGGLKLNYAVAGEGSVNI